MEPSKTRSSSRNSRFSNSPPKNHPSATWSPHSRPSSAHLLQRQPSLKLVPLISRFEALEPASGKQIATQELQPAPLQLTRRRTRVGVDQQQQLSTIFSPDIRREDHDDEDDVFTDRYDPGTAEPAHDKGSIPCEYHLADKGVVGRGRSIDVKRSIDGKRSGSVKRSSDVKRTESKSIKDRIKFFDRALPSSEKREHSIVRLSSKIFHTNASPTTPSQRKDFATSAPGSSLQRTKPTNEFPMTPTRLPPGTQVPRSSHEKKEPIGIFSMTPTKTSPASQARLMGQLKSPFAFSVPLLPSPTKLQSSYTPSPPRVKLSDVYTDNSHLPARGRAILRRDTILPQPSPERSWSPSESPAPTTSPFKDHCRGQSIIPPGSNHQPIHSRRRILSDKIEAIYRERRKNSPLRISNNDGEDSRHSSLSPDHPDQEMPRSGGKFGSKIASLRRLFDGSFSKDAGSHFDHFGNGKPTKSMSFKRNAPYLRQKDSHGFHRTTSFLHAPSPEAKLESQSQKTSSPIRQKFASLRSNSKSGKKQEHTPKTKIGDRIKLFESIARGREKIERQFRESTSSGTIRKIGDSLSFRSGKTYSSLRGDDSSGVDADVDRYDGKKERQGRARRSKVGSWNEIHNKERGITEDREEDRSNDAQELDLIIKEAECRLRQPKPLRLAEMKRMKALCKGFQEKISASREKDKEKTKAKEKGKDREKSGDSLKTRVPP
ncbi:hypothetical protein PVAG01_06682 [Phlyctema vagabunda]|uniref:Uncharacterized protein n=1 Tax=Phlyctema vagabunda TaxID=108571 RepID=A0ABR4PHQ2_9HELO